MSETDDNRNWGGLLRRRSCLVPTWRGWLLILVAGTALTFFAVKNVHSFLAFLSILRPHGGHHIG